MKKFEEFVEKEIRGIREKSVLFVEKESGIREKSVLFVEKESGIREKIRGIRGQRNSRNSWTKKFEEFVDKEISGKKMKGTVLTDGTLLLTN